MSQLTAKTVIDRMHLLLPETRSVHNSRSGRAVRYAVEDRGGMKEPIKDRYTAEPRDPSSPRSGQRYRIDAQFANGLGLDDLAMAAAAHVGWRRRSGKNC